MTTANLIRLTVLGVIGIAANACVQQLRSGNDALVWHATREHPAQPAPRALEWPQQHVLAFSDAALTVLDSEGAIVRQASLESLGFTRLYDVAAIDIRLFLLGSDASGSRLISVDDRFTLLTEQRFPAMDGGHLASHEQRLCYALIHHDAPATDDPAGAASGRVLLGASQGRMHWQAGVSSTPLTAPLVSANDQHCAFTDRGAFTGQTLQAVRTAFYSERGFGE